MMSTTRRCIPCSSPSDGRRHVDDLALLGGRRHRVAEVAGEHLGRVHELEDVDQRDRHPVDELRGVELVFVAGHEAAKPACTSPRGRGSRSRAAPASAAGSCPTYGPPAFVGSSSPSTSWIRIVGPARVDAVELVGPAPVDRVLGDRHQLVHVRPGPAPARAAIVVEGDLEACGRRGHLSVAPSLPRPLALSLLELPLHLLHVPDPVQVDAARDHDAAAGAVRAGAHELAASPSSGSGPRRCPSASSASAVSCAPRPAGGGSPGSAAGRRAARAPARASCGRPSSAARGARCSGEARPGRRRASSSAAPCRRRRRPGLAPPGGRPARLPVPGRRSPSPPRRPPSPSPSPSRRRPPLGARSRRAR